MAHSLRKLSEAERDDIMKVAKKLRKKISPDSVRVSYDRDGNFTTCLIKAGTKFATGPAKRNPGADEDRPEAAERRSFNRATRKLFAE